MQTLTYGFQKPATGDKGSTFFTALEADLQQLNDHTHNGVDSAKITPASTVAVSQSIGVLGWAPVDGILGGLYSQLITMPAGLTYDGNVIEFRVTVASVPTVTVFLSRKRESSTTYTLYTGFPSTHFVAIYT